MRHNCITSKDVHPSKAKGDSLAWLNTVTLLAIPARPAIAESPTLEDIKNIGERGIVYLPSNWKLAPSSGWRPINLSTDELIALKTLCRLAIRANGVIWQSERLNAAISVLPFGANPPDNLGAAVFKTCMNAGDMDPSMRRGLGSVYDL